MKSKGERAQQRLRTRTAILDATESIMREEGYAAVSSRRIAERAGLNSHLVHYHFGNMDELYLALFRRSEDMFFSHLSKVLDSPEPLKELWDANINMEETTLVLEFTAIATQRKVFRDELIRSAHRARSLENAILSKAFGNKKSLNFEVTPNILLFILQSVSRAVSMEKRIGITKGHSEILEFIENNLENWELKTDSN